MPLLSEELYAYISRYSEEEPSLLQEIRREAHIHLVQPRMLSGGFQGRLLKLLVAIAKPRNILEIGSYSGYSTLCLAEGLQQAAAKGKVFAVEAVDELEDFLRSNFSKSPFGERIELIIGRAEEVVPSLLDKHTIDFVYIDANKRHYADYYQMIIEKLPSGALIVADNTLWDGKVLSPVPPKDPQTQGILLFNELVAGDGRVEVIILPVRDGLSLIRKR